LDQPTLLVTGALSIALSAALLCVARRRGPGVDPLAWWAIAMGLGATGLLLRASPLPPFVSLDIAKTLLLLAAAAGWTAARVFAGRKPQPFVAASGAVVWLIACQIPIFADWHDGHVALTCAIGAGYTVAAALALGPVRTENLPSLGPARLLLFGHAGLYGLRSLMAVAGLDQDLEAPWITLLLLEAPLHTAGMAFVLVAMTKERAERVTERSLAEARTANDARRRFLADMSHEIRTPLNGILGLARLLRRETGLRPEQRQHLQTLEAAGRHLLALVNDALDLARIDADRLDINAATFSPAGAAEACLALVRPSAQEKHVALQLSLDAATPALVRGDSTRLQQILLNLLWNAIRFTPQGGSVVLRVGCLNGLNFDVVDTGPGIPVEKRSMLFKDFSQLETSSGGTGLGLSISSRLATRMGGEIRYLPGPDGVGSLFRLTLPWRLAASSGVGEGRPAGGACQNGLRLLVVDDVASNRMLLGALLSAEGHTIVEATGGAEAIRLIAHDDFDAVLLDARMPDVDGPTVARQVRAGGGSGARVPIIGVSADVMPDTLRLCHESGMDLVLPKPIEREALMDALHRLTLPALAPSLVPAGLDPGTAPSPGPVARDR
jgi:signal transduction histidine kinase